MIFFPLLFIVLFYQWRSKRILSSTLERSIFQKEKWRFVGDKSLNKDGMKMLKINSSMDTIKVMKNY